MTIPVEILCLWEKYYKRGDYAEICRLLRNTGYSLTPKQLVNYIHNASMPEYIYNVFEGFYIGRDK